MHPETGVTLMKLLSLPCSTSVDDHQSSTFNLIKANPLTVKHTSGLDGDRDERTKCLQPIKLFFTSLKGEEQSIPSALTSLSPSTIVYN